MNNELPILLPHLISFKDLEILVMELIIKYNTTKEQILIYEVNGIEGDIELTIKN